MYILQGVSTHRYCSFNLNTLSTSLHFITQMGELKDHTYIYLVVSHLKRLLSIRVILIIFFCFSSFLLALLWQKILTHQRLIEDESSVQVLDNISQDLTYFDTEYLPKNLKYMLLWNGDVRDFAPFTFVEKGQRTFLKNNCSVVNCYITADRRLLGENYTNFDAIAFNGRTMNAYNLPQERSPRQKYIYFNMESAANFPVCDKKYDGFFNLTATYKLDSDIPTPYLLIRDKNHFVVGPKRRMQWRPNMPNINVDNLESLINKSKAAAWFVSNCHTRNKRHVFAGKLRDALVPYGLDIDVYGRCGKFKCPKRRKKAGREACNVLLKWKYYFYLALENSFAEDYVTEKLLTALNYDVVPIVYGGADYSRFLPPGSYINGRHYKLAELATLVDRLIRSPNEYSRYFNWKQYYTLHNPGMHENMCNLCEVLNDKTLMEKITIYNNFRSWWNVKGQCK